MMNNIIKRINNNYVIKKNRWIVIFFLFFPHVYHIMFPDGSIPIIEFLCSRFRLLSFLIINVVFFIIKRKTPSKLLVLLYINELWILITTIINNPININKSILYISSSISIATLVECYFEDMIDLIKGMLLVFEIQLYPNLLTVVLFRNKGMYEAGYNINNFFLGTRNDLILYLFPAFLLCILYIIEIKKHKRAIALIIIILLTAFLIKSSTVAIVFVFFITLFLYLYLIKKNKIKKAYIYPLIIILITASIVLPYIIVKNNFVVEFFLNNIYYKQSFAERTRFWMSANEYIKSKPITGYGYLNNSIILNGVTEFGNLGNAHSDYVQRILNYGIIGYFLFAYFNYVLLKKLNNNKDSIYKTIFICFISCIYLTFVSQNYHRFFEFQLIFFIAYHLPKTNNIENK